MPASALRSDQLVAIGLARTVAGFLLICGAGYGYASPQLQFMSPVRSANTFPDPRHATRKEGIFVPRETVGLIAPGMTKRQVYALLGAPHFHEGLFGERTWDFILNFYTGTGTEYIVCQYQIRFDRRRRLASSAWNAEVCRLAVAPPQLETPKKIETAQKPPLLPHQLTVLFEFGSSSLSASAIGMLDEFAKSIESDSGEIRIIGHTDRAGSEAYNDVLGLARAAAVADRLEAGGVSRDRLNISGLGERKPAIESPDGVKEARNRRAELTLII